MFIGDGGDDDGDYGDIDVISGSNLNLILISQARTAAPVAVA